MTEPTAPGPAEPTVAVPLADVQRLATVATELLGICGRLLAGLLVSASAVQPSPWEHAARYFDPPGQRPYTAGELRRELFGDPEPPGDGGRPHG